ncbi:MAG: DNA-binding response regulator [Myxococcota bacterium]|nr:DNA-binding response regulator [Myxococcota bacterium]
MRTDVGLVRLLAEEEPVRTLLGDLILDRGWRLEEEGARTRRTVVVAQVLRGRGVLRALSEARLHHPGSPVVLVLPAPDDRLQEQAIRLGACCCYALGRPVAELFQALEVAWATGPTDEERTR